jgi:hypothetical protein
MELVKKIDCGSHVCISVAALDIGVRRKEEMVENAISIRRMHPYHHQHVDVMHLERVLGLGSHF